MRTVALILDVSSDEVERIKGMLVSPELQHIKVALMELVPVAVDPVDTSVAPFSFMGTGQEVGLYSRPGDEGSFVRKVRLTFKVVVQAVWWRVTPTLWMKGIKP